MKKINKLFSLLEGKILCFGIQEEKELKAIEENDKVRECFLLNSIDEKAKEEGKGGRRQRNITQKKLLKKFHKKNFDAVVIHEEMFKPYEKKLLFLFLKLTKKKIYLYHVSDLEKLEKKYKRYHATVYDRGEYIEVDLKNAKQNIFMNKWYFLVDSCIDFFDIMSDILSS